MDSTRAIEPVSGEPSAPRGTLRWRVLSVATILLLVLFQLPIVGWLVPGKSFAAMAGGEVVFWAMTLVILGYVAFVERRPLGSIGLKRLSWKSVVSGLIAAAIAMGGAVLMYTVIFPALGMQLNQAEASMSSLQSMPLWFQILLALRAAVFEEIFYRGFAIERLTEITGSRWLAALLSLAGFTAAHLSYWGWVPLIVVAFQGAVLTGLYLLRRDLGSNMIAHFASDVVSFLLL